MDDSVLHVLVNDFFKVYFIQVVVLVCVLWLMFSGSLKSLVTRVTGIKFAGANVSLQNTACTAARLVCDRHEEAVQKYDVINRRLSMLEQHVEEIWVDQLKDTFYTQHDQLPVGDRLYAGLRYVWWGQNGQMKYAVECMIKKYPEVYQSIIKLRPELEWGNMRKKSETLGSGGTAA